MFLSYPLICLLWTGRHPRHFERFASCTIRGAQLWDYAWQHVSFG